MYLISMVGDSLAVLVVDDDPEIRELYAQLLSGDYDVRTAADGRTAMERLSAAIDVVFLDRRLPGPSGLDVAAVIDRSEYDPAVAIVSHQRADLDLAAAPIDHYLQKPVGRADLTGVLQAVRSRRQYRDAVDELYGLAADLAAAEASRASEELAGDDRHQRLQRQLETTKEQVDLALDRCTADWERVFETVSAEGQQAGASGDSRAEPEGAPDGHGWEAI